MNTNNNNTAMAVLAYLGPLVIVSLITSRNVPFVKFHIKQGLVLLAIEVIIWILGTVLWPLWMIFQLVNLATLVLAIIGIVNVTQNKEKELPVVGGFAHYFKV